jgi:hypothetical protein
MTLCEPPWCPPLSRIEDAALKLEQGDTFILTGFKTKNL